VENQINNQILKKLYIDKKMQVNEIAALYGKTNGSIRYLLSKFKISGTKGYNKSKINPLKVDANNPILWYYTGLFAADGYIKPHKSYISLRLTIKNNGSYEVLSKVAAYFEFENIIRQYKNNFNELEIVSDELLQHLINSGIPAVNKTFEIKCAENIPNVECFKMYLRGIFDGDGSICYKVLEHNRLWGGGFKLVSASEDFIVTLSKKMFSVLNIDTRNLYKYNNCYNLATNAQQGMALFNMLYDNYQEYALPDKYNKYLALKEYKESDNYWKKHR
jgi:DNA-binding transcriptional regulator WhiA